MTTLFIEIGPDNLPYSPIPRPSFSYIQIAHPTDFYLISLAFEGSSPLFQLLGYLDLAEAEELPTSQFYHSWWYNAVHGAFS